MYDSSLYIGGFARFTERYSTAVELATHSAEHDACLAGIARRSYYRGMSRSVSVHFLPELIDSDELPGSLAVVIDLLRASTTIVHALDSGAQSVIPCISVEEARKKAAEFGSRQVLLGGERAGVRIEGFELDNSPLHYTPERVGGKTIVFTTTNGTRALLAAGTAAKVFVGALANLQSLIDQLKASTSPVRLVCAGTNGRISSEDVLCAGAIVAGLSGESDGLALDDSSHIALGYFERCSGDEAAIVESLRLSRGGRNLVKLGFEDDIRFAAVPNRHDVVPVFDPITGRIQLEPS
jgi:2-phosphosulfolactate phosphatase